MYEVGDRVIRNEDHEIRGAEVLAIEVIDGEQNLLLAYDEGGSGWWPASAVEPE
jgi:hypothetical protein